jgi:tight adherence protein C
VVDAPHHGGPGVSLALALLAAAAVLVVAWRHQPAPARIQFLAARPRGQRRRRSPAVARLGAAALVTAAGALVLPAVAPLLGLAAWAVPVVRRRRRRGDATEAVRRSLPEAIDLLRLAVGAGLNIPRAVEAAAAHGAGPVATELRRVAAQVAGGGRCADALDEAGVRLGAVAQPVLAALAASDRYGAPLQETLARLAADARADRRRRAEELARRIPVRLLFPLVVCILPAFALLTVAPLIAGGLGSLRL